MKNCIFMLSVICCIFLQSDIHATLSESKYCDRLKACERYIAGLSKRDEALIRRVALLQDLCAQNAWLAPVYKEYIRDALQSMTRDARELCGRLQVCKNNNR